MADSSRQPIRWHTAISDGALSLDDAHAFVADPRAGATVVFTGLVRNHALDEGASQPTADVQAPTAAAGRGPHAGDVATSQGGPVRPVTGLDYEAFPEMAEQRLAQLAADVSAKWPDICAGWAVHRVGRLAVGDAAVVVAVSSPHRTTAFEAGRHLIDTLKATVPIWKKEHWADGGSHWPGTD